MQKHWWQEAILYQVYLRSFKDTTGDGIGDLRGVVQKLDYLKDLGVDTVWVSPHYDSPMDDNGYDIRDFYKVSSDYGTLDDFKTLLREAHNRGMKIVIDLVLNHTSDEHPWFVAARDPKHPDHEVYKDFYIWQKPKYEKGKRKRPTRWRSWFGGPAWTYNDKTDEYYLHIFSEKMPDLNWRNEKMREAMKDVIRFWIQLGVDGFRVDASNHLEKNWDFPDTYPGYENFSGLPKHHEYLEELGKELFEPNDLLVLGEAGGATKEEALRYAGFDSHEFNMLIHFEHCWVDTDEENALTPGKWAKGEVDVVKLKKSLSHWHDIMQGKGWNAIYWHNHDHPRIVSHYGDDGKYWERSAKMLAIALYMLPGTPIVYYGEEIGMTNVDYERLEDFRDVEVFTEYENFRQNGASHETAMRALRDRSRDSGRSPMQWNGQKNAGFSEGTPWMPVNNNYERINVDRQKNASDSIWRIYKELLQLRREESLAFSKATFYQKNHPENFLYHVQGDEHEYFVAVNFKEVSIEISLPEHVKDYSVFKTNVENSDASLFKPYEARIYRKRW